MKILQKLYVFVIAISLTIFVYVSIHSANVEAVNHPSYTKLKELITKVQNSQSVSKISKVSPMIKSRETTTTRILAFDHTLSEEEKATLAERYKIEFSARASKNNRYVVTPSSEERLQAMVTDGKAKKIYNNVTYKIEATAQTIDWGVGAINAPAAWLATTPDLGGNVVVAVIDTGVVVTSPELSASIEAGGYDFVNDDSDPTDDNGHGTHIAGIIVAADNSASTRGVAAGAKVLPFKVCNNVGVCSSEFIANAIDAAVAAHVDIINMSLGGGEDALVQESVNNATAAGVIVAAAAGNGDEFGVGQAHCLYPAAFSNVVCVGALDSNKAKTSFSNYGPELDVMTPGLSILSTNYLGGNAANMSGTSQATAYYSGAAALVDSMIKALCVAEPTNVACSDKRAYVQSLLNEFSTQDLGAPGRDDQFGNGAIDLSQLFTDTNITYTAPKAKISKDVIYTQPFTITNNNSFDIDLHQCKVMSHNTSRTQTVPAFEISELKQGETVNSAPTTNAWYDMYTLDTPVQILAGQSANFVYTYKLSSESVIGDSISYSFECTFGRGIGSAAETYRSEAKIGTTVVDSPTSLKDLYITFGKFKYNKYVAPYMLRLGDTVYFKNFDPKKTKYLGMILYDYAKKGNQCYNKTIKTSSSVKAGSCIILPANKRYAFILSFQDIKTGIVEKKYFVVNTGVVAPTK